MISLDTNVLLRLVLNDDPDQVSVAKQLIAQPCFIAPTVLVEVGWALRSVYRLDRKMVAAALLVILEYPAVEIDNVEAVRWALTRHAAAVSDLADLLHLACSPRAAAFGTFDRKLAQQAGQDMPLPVQTLLT